MKRTWKVLASAILIISGMAFANQPKTTNPDPAAPPPIPPIPPIPPKVQNEESLPSVVITEKEGERIEEYTQNGRTYMIKITPIKGPAYYYMDTDGDGQLELRESDRQMNPVRPVFWKLKTW